MLRELETTKTIFLKKIALDYSALHFQKDILFVFCPLIPYFPDVCYKFIILFPSSSSCFVSWATLRTEMVSM